MKIIWTASRHDTNEIIAERVSSTLAVVNTISKLLAAEMITEGYFDRELLEEHDDGSGEVDMIVEIFEPVDLAGKYRVTLKLEVEATAVPFKEED